MYKYRIIFLFLLYFLVIPQFVIISLNYELNSTEGNVSVYEFFSQY